MQRSSEAEAAENQRTGPYPLIWRMKYVWIEESPNTASDAVEEGKTEESPV